jgi:hypothetical protein
MQLTIYDSEGRALNKLNITSRLTKIDRNSISKGIYFGIISSKNSIEKRVKRIVE